MLNSSMEEISQKYIMEQIPKGSIPQNALYSEVIPGGQTVIRKENS